MEKRRPHYRLATILEAISDRGSLAFTRISREGIREMGLTLDQAMRVVATLDASCFYKSMTTIADHRIWQDVYHASTPAGRAYVKFTLRDDGAVVISFKRL